VKALPEWAQPVADATAVEAMELATKTAETLNDLKQKLDTLTAQLQAVQSMAVAQYTLNGDVNAKELVEFGKLEGFLDTHLRAAEVRRAELAQRRLGGALGSVLREITSGASGR
jgi:hypothetical protein